MRHFATPGFWQRYHELSPDTRALADEKYALLKADPKHPSLHFKKVGRFWSCRVGLRHRVLGVEHTKGVVWFWIGTHAEYDRLVG